MSIIALMCWSGFVFVVSTIDPESAGVYGYAFFYGTLFCAVVATLSVFGFILRTRLLKGEVAFRQVSVTFRQAIWFGVLVTTALWLQTKDLLNWWNLLLLIIVLSVFEFFFLSLRRQSREM